MITTQNQTISDFIKLLIVSMLLVLLFAKPLSVLLKTWWVNDDYSHGFFVLPLSLYMVWQKRDILKSIDNSPSWIAFSLFVLSLIVYLAALLARFHTLLYAAMIMLLSSLCLSLLGWKKSKYFLGAVLFLVFMFPIPSSIYISITNPLKLFTTSISVAIIQLVGIPVLKEGNLLFFANTRLEVAEACSGLRSIYSYLMLGIVFSYFCKRMISKTVLIFSAIPLAIIVNIVRVTLTGILSHYIGKKVAQGFFHEFAGMVLFFAGLVLMYATYYLVESYFIKKQNL